VGEQLFEALKQFYTMFPEQRINPFYIMAESYGGIQQFNVKYLHNV
jgi:carboxypeptidase C (cathepsin A)